MTIGVSGASGHLGSSILQDLVDLGGHAVVGVTRTPESVPVPAEGRLGDYDRPETLAEAYAGLDRLVLVPSAAMEPGVRARQAVGAIDAAVEAGVGLVVFVSSAGTKAVREPDIFASYYAAEQHLMRTAPRWTVVRMNYYAESFVQEALMSLGGGALPGLAENRVAFVSREDVAAAVAGLLTSDGHDGAVYHATGPERLSGAERAASVAEASGRPFAFAVFPEDVLRSSLEGAGLPGGVVGAVLSIQRHFAEGAFDVVTGDVERLAGRPPRSLRDLLKEAFAGDGKV
ncbi:NAD(P)-dependent oxidoreductase [Rubrivirga sp. SAORIC476]|uniref:SDR family oxidoreductase n=1 Tax=Rubrivirga sp. SAORIC476 TaxID=1961794 RepID=UPI000BA9359F|nr:NAD(P)-dependent oxidoreductase [Pimelobacter sp.]PAP79002.1 NAD(P)-dependent oxidoreductase [Rubrivirga sp. SAORIC476]